MVSLRNIKGFDPNIFSDYDPKKNFRLKLLIVFQT